MTSKINSEEIVEFLERKEIFFEWVNPQKSSYILASLYEPIKKGFYFFCGDKLPKKITESLILIQTGNPSIVNSGQNSFLVIDANPQSIYYSILRQFFARESSGVLSPSAIISPNAKIGKNV